MPVEITLELKATANANNPPTISGGFKIISHLKGIERNRSIPQKHTSHNRFKIISHLKGIERFTNYDPISEAKNRWFKIISHLKGIES